MDAPDTRREPVVVALWIAAWVLGLGLVTFAGTIIGLAVSNAVSDCRSLAGNAMHCFGPALMGAGLGAVGGFVIGCIAVVGSGRRLGLATEAKRTIASVIVLAVVAVLVWPALNL